MASSSTELAIFHRVAERGSFAGAAEDVGLSPSAAGHSQLTNAVACRRFGAC
jgi:hypothetical protein